MRYFCSAKAAETVINTSPQVPSVSMLTLKLNADPQVFKLTDVVQSVNGITCEAGDGFHIDEVNLPGATVCNHTHEIRPLFCSGAGDAGICIDAIELPTGIMRHML